MPTKSPNNVKSPRFAPLYVRNVRSCAVETLTLKAVGSADGFEQPDVSTPRARNWSSIHCPSSLATIPRTAVCMPSFARPQAVMAAPPPTSLWNFLATDSSPGRGQDSNPLITRSKKRSPTTSTSKGRPLSWHCLNLRPLEWPFVFYACPPQIGADAYGGQGKSPQYEFQSAGGKNESPSSEGNNACHWIQPHLKRSMNIRTIAPDQRDRNNLRHKLHKDLDDDQRRDQV